MIKISISSCRSLNGSAEALVTHPLPGLQKINCKYAQAMSKGYHSPFIPHCLTTGWVTGDLDINVIIIRHFFVLQAKDKTGSYIYYYATPGLSLSASCLLKTQHPCYCTVFCLICLTQKHFLYVSLVLITRNSMRCKKKRERERRKRKAVNGETLVIVITGPTKSQASFEIYN